MIETKNILPILLIIIDLVQAIICYYVGDSPRALYWFSAGLITYASMIM